MFKGTTRGLTSHSINIHKTTHKNRIYYNNNEISLKLLKQKNIDEVSPKLQTQWLQALHGHALNRMFFLSSWNPSIPLRFAERFP